MKKVICSRAFKDGADCRGCRHSVPHIHNEYADTEGICDSGYCDEIKGYCECVPVEEDSEPVNDDDDLSQENYRLSDTVKKLERKLKTYQDDNIYFQGQNGMLWRQRRELYGDLLNAEKYIKKLECVKDSLREKNVLLTREKEALMEDNRQLTEQIYKLKQQLILEWNKKDK